MILQRRLEPRFVVSFPEQLEPGVLYVSLEYGSAAHTCCCGCGEEVVTPITPTDWKFTYDGESISLWPSIGNWNLRCRSHYIIERGKVVESPAWTQPQIEAAKRRDKIATDEYFQDVPAIIEVELADRSQVQTQPEVRLWMKIKAWICGFWRE